ncbi:cupin domain-containing protein [Rhodococcus sp. SJ-3]|uniref:cupin domain-containing protein n=1 Tax=Rhodococcus sp. SJ-3 TaxID=3454628 RepID=UPI003F79E0F1
MDLLTDLLDGVRSRGAVLDRAGMARGWSIRIADGAPLMLVMVIDGHTWVLPDEAESVRAGQGDVLIVSGQSPYTVADQSGIAPQLVTRTAGVQPSDYRNAYRTYQSTES